MWNKFRERLENYKPTRNSILKIVPLVVFLTIFLLRISLGMADPNGVPPGPKP